MNVYEFARSYMYPYKVKGDEIVAQKCPFCHGGNSHDKDSFALNTVNKTYNCKRGSCNKQGHFTTLCKEFGHQADSDNNYSYEIFKPKKEYKKPTTIVKDTTTQAEKYLGIRKISKSTMDRLKVGCDDKGNIVFPYYENDELVFVKFRPARKVDKGERKAWREEGGKPILWGMDLCDTNYPLIITEGEIDTLSLYEAGLRNAVSIPSGCEDFSWVENCWDWLQGFNKIILFGDSDNAGKEMIRKTIQKLGSYRCSIVENTRKDANEILYFDGVEAINNLVNNAKDIPIHGLIDLSDVETLDVANMKYIKSGIRALDEATGGFIYGDLSVWTGKRGEGKSTLIGQILIDAIESGEKVCAYSGELGADRFQYWINLQIAGKRNIKSKFDKYRNKDVYFVDPEAEQKIKQWYRGKFFLYDNKISENESEETSILKIFEYAVKKYDVKVFMVDNLMTAKYSSNNETDFYLQQTNFIRDLCKFANNYNVHVHLVAHPKKTKGSLGNDDISGRSEITNLAHNVFSVERVEEQSHDLTLRVLKNRWEGNKEEIGLCYCPVSRRLYQPSQGALKEYGWNEIVLPTQIEEICPF